MSTAKKKEPNYYGTGGPHYFTTSSDSTTVDARTEVEWKKAPGYQMGYSAGLRDGAARERRALLNWLQRSSYADWKLLVKDWLANRKGKK